MIDLQSNGMGVQKANARYKIEAASTRHITETNG